MINTSIISRLEKFITPKSELINSKILYVYKDMYILYELTHYIGLNTAHPEASLRVIEIKPESLPECFIGREYTCCVICKLGDNDLNHYYIYDPELLIKKPRLSFI